MGQSEFIEVVSVRNSEVEWCREDHACWRHLCQHMKRYNHGPKHDFLSHRPSDVVPPPYPRSQSLAEICPTQPCAEPAVYDCCFEERSCKEDGAEEDDAEKVERIDGPASKEVQRLQRCCVGGLGQDNKHNAGGESTSRRNGAYPGTNDGGSVAGQSGRRSSGFAEVEGNHVEESETDLEIKFSACMVMIQTHRGGAGAGETHGQRYSRPQRHGWRFVS